ncbi:hypothetical protein NC652_015063 [Populus alba x Populus x berolinensis]|nr:hypothetical protein NC652_015063 [Populus alba x Populus x berolinensis]
MQPKYAMTLKFWISKFCKQHEGFRNLIGHQLQAIKIKLKGKGHQVVAVENLLQILKASPFKLAFEKEIGPIPPINGYERQHRKRASEGNPGYPGVGSDDDARNLRRPCGLAIDVQATRKTRKSSSLFLCESSLGGVDGKMRLCSGTPNFLVPCHELRVLLRLARAMCSVSLHNHHPPPHPPDDLFLSLLTLASS